MLSTAAGLLELGEETRELLSNTQDDTQGLRELFQEISPEAGSREARESQEDWQENESLLSKVDESLMDADSVKWDARYLHQQAQRRTRRVGNLARLGTRIIRLGKKVGRLVNRSASDRTAYNTENLVNQGYLNSQNLSEIRTLLREQKDREARERLQGVINTTKALQAVLPDFDQQISERETRRLASAQSSKK